MLSKNYNNRSEAIANDQQQVPPPLNQLQLDEMKAAIEEHLNNCLWYRIQCTNCEHAASMIGVETDTVRQWIKKGKLSASKVGNEWLIPLHCIDAMIKKYAIVVNINSIPKPNRKAS